MDEEAAEVIREIFRRVVAGESGNDIARTLQARGLLTPNNYKNTKDGKPPSEFTIWSGRTIHHLIDNPTYVGLYIAQKHTTPSYKNHKRIIRSEEEWVKIENHHPAIVDLETFEAAKRLRDARRRITKRGDKGELSGLLFCKDCGSKLALAHQQYDYYICNKYRARSLYETDHCTRHAIRREAIAQIALVKIQETIALALGNKERFIAEVNKSANKDTEKAIKHKAAELAKAERRIADSTALSAAFTKTT
ncbi:MAG: recombinase family protein [Clostridiales bacterium]|nr:recombinase family protein [Clostridiales bacterium]